MLGSFHDAEDMVEETFLRAWRGLPSFDGRAPMRHWLYRIATNTCQNALASRGRIGRVLPETYGPPTDKMPDREPASEVRWLEPYPNSALEGIVDRSAGPDARYEMREAVQLAFIATIQLLPARICTEATHLEAAPERFSWEWAAMLHAHEAGITATRSGRPVNLEWQLSSADPCQPQSAPRQASDVAVFAKLRQEERRAGYGWTDSAIQLRYSLLPSSMVTAMHSGRS